MKREERLVEIRRLLEREPSVQRRWVWECREKILEYLIARYGGLMLEPDSSEREYVSPPVGPQPRGGHQTPMPPDQVRLILENIAQLNERSRESGHTRFPGALRN